MKKKLTVQAEEEELALWREAAYLRRSTLSAWVRRVLTATATSIKEKSDE